MDSINNSLKNLKEQQIQGTEEKKNQLEKEFKEKMFILIGILMSLSAKYNNSNSEYTKLKIKRNIKEELNKYKNFLIKYQNNFIGKALRNTFDSSYNELYAILKLLYNNDIFKSNFTEESINKIIHSKFFDKTLNERITDNTSMMFNKMHKEINEKITTEDPTLFIAILNDDFDSLIKIENRLLDTEETRLFNEAQKKAFEDFGIEHLIWRSVLEANTCAECASRDGKPFSIDDIDMIPLHSNCNCYWEIV